MTTPTRSCPNCGDTLPREARFCGSCGQILPPLVEEERDEERGGIAVLPLFPGTASAGAASANLAAGGAGAPSPGAGLSAGAQSIGGQGAGAGAQSVAPSPMPAGTPSASAPSLPGGASAGAGGGATSGAAAGAVSGLLATLPAKIIAVVLALVVVTAGTTAVLAGTGKKIFGSGGPSGAHPTSAVKKPSPTSAANAPGPNGAPSNSATFKLTLTIVKSGSVYLIGNPQNMLVVMGGKVCGPHDNGQPFTYPDPERPGQTDTTTTTCSGSYQGGKLTYTQTVIQIIIANAIQGFTCTITAASPWMVHLEGTFTGPTAMSGTGLQTHAAEPETCAGLGSISIPAANDPATFTGTLTTAP